MSHIPSLAPPLSTHQHSGESGYPTEGGHATSAPAHGVQPDAMSTGTPLYASGSSHDDIAPSRSSGFNRSASSTSTAREEDIETLRRKRSKELGSPSEKQFKRAGMTGVGAVGAGAGVAGLLAHNGDKTPASWKNVSVDDKHQVWSSHVASPRKAMLKVCLYSPREACPRQR